MAIQGIMTAAHRKAIHYSVQLSQFKASPDFHWLRIQASSDFNAIAESLMGIVRSLEYKQKYPMDIVDFYKKENSPTESSKMALMNQEASLAINQMKNSNGTNSSSQ